MLPPFAPLRKLECNLPLLAHGQTTLVRLCRRQRQTEYSKDFPAPQPHSRVCVLWVLVPPPLLFVLRLGTMYVTYCTFHFFVFEKFIPRESCGEDGGKDGHNVFAGCHGSAGLRDISLSAAGAC